LCASNFVRSFLIFFWYIWFLSVLAVWVQPDVKCLKKVWNAFIALKVVQLCYPWFLYFVENFNFSSFEVYRYLCSNSIWILLRLRFQMVFKNWFLYSLFSLMQIITGHCPTIKHIYDTLRVCPFDLVIYFHLLCFFFLYCLKGSLFCIWTGLFSCLKSLSYDIDKKRSIASRRGHWIWNLLNDFTRMVIDLLLSAKEIRFSKLLKMQKKVIKTYDKNFDSQNIIILISLLSA